MKTKAIAIRVLLSAAIAIMGITAVFAFGSDVDPDTSTEQYKTVLPKDSTASGDSTDSKESPELSSKVIAYYFHSTRRCYSCKKIEAYTEEAIKEGFKEQLTGGELEFYSINIDEKQNRHYVKDYQLYTKSLIVSKSENGKEAEWKNLTKIWQFYRSKEKFFKYVQDEIKAYLTES